VVVRSVDVNFELEFMPRLGRRARGFKILFDHLRKRAAAKADLVMVETGCIRPRHGALAWAAAGCSSILFDAFAAETKARFTSIDNDKDNCAWARKHCPHATIICGDSVKTLYELRKKIERIDLLYLDSYDVEWGAPHSSALHHLNELCAASRMLTRGSLVFIDDNTASSGKGLYIRQYMQSVGARQICEDYQIGFVMP